MAVKTVSKGSVVEEKTITSVNTSLKEHKRSHETSDDEKESHTKRNVGIIAALLSTIAIALTGAFAFVHGFAETLSGYLIGFEESVRVPGAYWFYNKYKEKKKK